MVLTQEQKLKRDQSEPLGGAGGGAGGAAEVRSHTGSLRRGNKPWVDALRREGGGRDTGTGSSWDHPEATA